MVAQVLQTTVGQAQTLDQVRPQVEQRLRAVRRVAEQARSVAAPRAAAQVEILVNL